MLEKSYTMMVIHMSFWDSSLDARDTTFVGIQRHESVGIKYRLMVRMLHLATYRAVLIIIIILIDVHIVCR